MRRRRGRGRWRWMRGWPPRGHKHSVDSSLSVHRDVRGSKPINSKEVRPAVVLVAVPLVASAVGRTRPLDCAALAVRAPAKFEAAREQAADDEAEAEGGTW